MKIGRIKLRDGKAREIYVDEIYQYYYLYRGRKWLIMPEDYKIIDDYCIDKK